MRIRGWEGAGALWLLMRMLLRGRLRRLRSPKRLALLVLVIGFMVLAAWASTADDGGMFDGVKGAHLVRLLLVFLFATTFLGALANGAFSFSPAELNFLFPGPIGTRALIGTHLLETFLKTLSGALVFALFIRPSGIPFGRVAAGYVLVFVFLCLLGVATDLAHLKLPRPVRRRRAGYLAVGLLAAATVVVLLTWRADGSFGAATLRHLSWPARPFVEIVATPPGEPVTGYVLTASAAVVALAAYALSYRGCVREAAIIASRRVHEKLGRLGKNEFDIDRKRSTTSGRRMPMLPHWGGAGVHAWRQLVTVSRRPRAYALTVALSIALAASTTFDGIDVDKMAGAALAMLTLLGPLYVPCDFRSDYQSLPYLRSLPTPATAMAAGQILASAGVLYALQLALGGWVLFATSAEHRPVWIAVFLALPLFNLIQLAIENAAFLIHPVRLDYSKRAPDAVALGRMYVVFGAKMIVLMVLAVLACGAAALVWTLLESPVAGVAVGLVVLAGEVLALIAFVGRLFLRLDPARDLTG